eukprot:9485797-Pyramimonas_sp.AAC.1
MEYWNVPELNELQELVFELMRTGRFGIEAFYRFSSASPALAFPFRFVCVRDRPKALLSNNRKRENTITFGSESLCGTHGHLEARERGDDPSVASCSGRPARSPERARTEEGGVVTAQLQPACTLPSCTIRAALPTDAV